MTDLWIAATANEDAEHLERVTSAAYMATAGHLGFLLEATTADEYEDRLAIVAAGVESAIERLTNRDATLFPIVHTEVLNAFQANFERLQQSREAEVLSAARRLRAQAARDARIPAKAAGIAPLFRQAKVEPKVAAYDEFEVEGTCPRDGTHVGPMTIKGDDQEIHCPKCHDRLGGSDVQMVMKKDAGLAEMLHRPMSTAMPDGETEGGANWAILGIGSNKYTWNVWKSKDWKPTDESDYGKTVIGLDQARAGVNRALQLLGLPGDANHPAVTTAKTADKDKGRVWEDSTGWNWEIADNRTSVSSGSGRAGSKEEAQSALDRAMGKQGDGLVDWSKHSSLDLWTAKDDHGVEMEVAHVDGRYVWGSYTPAETPIAEGIAGSLALAQHCASSSVTTATSSKTASIDDLETLPCYGCGTDIPNEDPEWGFIQFCPTCLPNAGHMNQSAENAAANDAYNANKTAAPAAGTPVVAARDYVRYLPIYLLRNGDAIERQDGSAGWVVRVDPADSGDGTKVTYEDGKTETYPKGADAKALHNSTYAAKTAGTPPWLKGKSDDKGGDDKTAPAATPDKTPTDPDADPKVAPKDTDAPVADDNDPTAQKDDPNAQAAPQTPEQQDNSDPTTMDVGATSHMGFTMGDGGTGQLEVTFIREEDGVYYFNGPTGEFGVGQQNGVWQDSEGNTFTFGAAPATDPKTQAVPNADDTTDDPEQSKAPDVDKPADGAGPNDKNANPFAKKDDDSKDK